MEYVNYERDIVEKYEVELVDWTYPTWTCSNKMSNNPTDLEVLLSALHCGECRFVNLTNEPVKARHGERMRQIEAGKLPAPNQ